MILGERCWRSGSPVLYLERGPFPGTIQIDEEGVLAGTAIAKASSWHWPEDADPERWRGILAQAEAAYREGNEIWWAQPKGVGPKKAAAALYNRLLRLANALYDSFSQKAFREAFSQRMKDGAVAGAVRTWAPTPYSISRLFLPFSSFALHFSFLISHFSFYISFILHPLGGG